MALTKVTYSMIDGNIVNAKDFGVDITGTTDSSAALQTALNACAGGKILQIYGDIKLDNQVIVPSTIGGICGDGINSTTITYTKEQTGVEINDSAIIIDTVSGATFSDFSLVYTGTFNDPNNSYFGKVVGLYVVDCDDITIDGIEATGFNDSGIRFTGNVRNASNLCKRNKVTNCYLHHNRVAGCLYGIQQEFIFEKNYCSYNGYVKDGGTGYGVAAVATSKNTLVTITNCITDHNYRTGIDIHECDNFIISNNISYGDRIFGIAVESRDYQINAVNISNNTIQVDANFYVSSTDDPLGTYANYKAISVNINPYGTVIGYTSIPIVKINNNIIYDIGCADGSHTMYGIYVESNVNNDSEIQIVNNNIRGSYVSLAIIAYRAGGNGKLITQINNNNLETPAVTTAGIAITFNNVGSTENWGECWVENNYLNTAALGSASLININDGYNFARVNNNKVNATTSYGIPLQIQYSENAEVWVNNNAITMTTTTYLPMSYGQNIIISGKGNTYNGALLTVPEYRNNYRGGSNTKTVVPVKSLTASSATPLVWVGEYKTISEYIVKWSAYYNDSTTGLAMTGGVFSFIAGYSDNNKAAKSAITSIANDTATQGTASALSITWALDTPTAGNWVYRLVATSNHDCTIYAEIEQVSVLNLTVSPQNPII